MIIDLALDNNNKFVGRLRGISPNPRAGMTTSPHEMLKVELLESYQSPRQLLACTLFLSFSAALWSFTSVSLSWSVSFFSLQTGLL